MSAHFFIAPSSFSTDRWGQAFPDAHFVRTGEVPASLRAGDVVWVCDLLPDWQTLVQGLRQQYPDCPVVVLTTQPGQALALSALELGARGVCHALAVPSVLGEVAAVVSHGGLWVGPELVERMLAAVGGRLGATDSLEESVLASLSEREAAVARLVVAGQSNKAVAQQLGITERTVKAHLSSIFSKLGVRDRVQLMLRCRPRSVPVQSAAV